MTKSPLLRRQGVFFMELSFYNKCNIHSCYEKGVFTVKKWAIPCQNCKQFPGSCYSCTKITRESMAGYLRKEIPIYLSEENRHNRMKKTTPRLIEATRALSCRDAAFILGVSAQTISRERRRTAAVP